MSFLPQAFSCACSNYCFNVLFKNISQLHKFLFLNHTKKIKVEQILGLTATNSQVSAHYIEDIGILLSKLRGAC